MKSRRVPYRSILFGAVGSALFFTPAEAHPWPAALLVAPSGAPVADSSAMVAHEAAEAPKLFPVHPSMEPSIRFWTDVFSRYDSDKVLLHDREDLSIVWQVVSLPLAEDGTIKPVAAQKEIIAARDALSSRLRRLERNPAPVDHEDHQLLAIVGEDSRRLAGAATRLRAQRGIAGNFKRGLERSRKWLPQVAAILEKKGVPVELRALPFIESGFNPWARSAAGAAGLWQLMPATARQLGLKVNATIDERLDVLKATSAAATMLKQNHAMLASWPLAITGYNHGPYGMQRAVKAVGSNDITVLIEKYERRSFGFASKNFYVEFLAALRLVDGLTEEDKAAAGVAAAPAEETTSEERIASSPSAAPAPSGTPPATAVD